MKDRCAGLCEVILPITSVPELIWRWPKMLRNREQWRSQNAGASWRFLRSEDFTIATSARRPSPSGATIMASGIVPWSCEPKSSRAKARSHPGCELLFALAALRFRTPCSLLQSSPDQLFWQTVIVCGVFGNDSTSKNVLNVIQRQLRLRPVQPEFFQ